MNVLDCVYGEKGGKISATESTEVFTINMSTDSSMDLPRNDVEGQTHQSEIKISSFRRHILWKVFLDIPLIVIVLAVLGLYELGVIPSHQAGFYCNDPALSFPFRGDTVTTELLISTLLIVPLVVVVVTEFTFTRNDYSIFERVKLSLRKSLWVYKCYAYGLICNVVVVEIMKGITGNPRPTFSDLCEPDTAKTCNGSEFVSSFVCTSTKYSSWAQYDSYHSFPSGHTSMSVHAGVFLAWYLQRRAFSWQSRTTCLVPVLQLLSISYSAVCSLTRITDHRHHWWDVLTGAVIGAFSVCYTVFVLLNNLGTRDSVKRPLKESFDQHSRTNLANGARILTA